MQEEDAQIIHGLSSVEGQDKALRQLVLSHGQIIHAQIRKMVGPDDADDVFQNVLIKVLRYAATFDGRSSLRTWLFRIANNEATDFLRAKSRRLHLHGPSLQDESFDFNGLKAAEIDLPESSTLHSLLAEAIETLPAQQKAVFEARYFKESSYAEIALQTGKSENTLKVNFHHALRKVSEYLRAYAQNIPT